MQPKPPLLFVLPLLAMTLLPGSFGFRQKTTPAVPAPADGRYLYVAVPGIRNYLEWGGAGILVYDVDAGHRWVKRIPTFEAVPGKTPEATAPVVTRSWANPEIIRPSLTDAAGAAGSAVRPSGVPAVRP